MASEQKQNVRATMAELLEQVRAGTLSTEAACAQMSVMIAPEVKLSVKDGKALVSLGKGQPQKFSKSRAALFLDNVQRIVDFLTANADKLTDAD